MKLLNQNHKNIKKEEKKNYSVKLNQLKLDIGLFGGRGSGVLTAVNDKVAVQIISGTSSSYSSPPSSLSSLLRIPFHRNPNSRCSHTTPATRFLSAKAPSITWDARDLSNYHLVLKQNNGSLEIAFDFHVLYGEGVVGESDGEMTVVGKASTVIAVAEEMMKKTESNSCSHRNIQRKVPIKLRVNGLLMEASLSVSMKLTRVKNSSCCDDESARPIENSVESKKRHAIIERVKYLTSFTNMRGKNGKPPPTNPKVTEKQTRSPYESDGSPSPVFDSDDSSESTTSSGSSSNNSSGIIIIENDSSNSGSRFSKSGGNKNESERFIMGSSATRTCLVGRGNRNGLRVSRNRSFTGLGFNSITTKQEFQDATRSRALTKSHDELSSSHSRYQEKNCSTSRWKSKEISSRDGKLKLKTNVFFASFDQMSEQASGDSACSVLVALIAHWLHSNNNMPTMSQFDNLITQGSSEWRKLCKSDCYLKLFPDKHFDLETVLEANLRPIIVVPQESYTGFFSPEKFQCLKGAMSFDQIWDEIRTKVDNKPRIYIVSWNDHFFVLKVEKDAYYVIDSLGERLYEGCQQAFILKFDQSSVMYRKVERKQPLVVEGGGSSRFEVACRGKECCKEFIKRFLAAISVRQLEKEEKKGNVSNPFLHRQLQIDFHYSTITSTSSAIRH